MGFCLKCTYFYASSSNWSKLPMKLRSSTLLLLLSSALLAGHAVARPNALFYMTEEPASIESFLAHASKIDILVPTWYSVDSSGLVWGGPDALVMETARRQHVRVMPIIVNPGFHQDTFHKLAGSPEASSRLTTALVRECQKSGYIGFQFDFENIEWTDRDALTALVSSAAHILHANGFQLSIATVPNAPGYPGTGGFSRWIYENWRGAYDLKALAQNADLICLMTYDEHTRYTPPGPVAGYAWTLANLEYALNLVPKEKLSLGIPVYGYRWFAGDPGKDGHPSVSVASAGATEVKQLIEAFHPRIEWDDGDRTSWFYFYRDATREWVFYTDARTFKERLDLAGARGLNGFCSWVLGREDPEIWDLLPVHR